jgi:hypothetical protein
MLSLDSDEKRLLIVFMPIFAKALELGINYRQGTEAQGAEPKTHASLLLDYVSAGSELSEKTI